MIVAINVIMLLLLGVPVLYFAVFALAAAVRKPQNACASQNRSFVILIPAYKSDSCIMDTALSAAAQNYPAGKFRVLVISDSMQADTVANLRGKNIEVLEVSFENSTKAKSLAEALKYLGPKAADAVAILDADNIVDSGFLAGIDAAMKPGTAIQAHRTAKNRDTAVAVIDAASEEINNTIFRLGHNAAGLSSALIG